MDRYQQSSPGGGAKLLAEATAQVLEEDLDFADVERQLDQALRRIREQQEENVTFWKLI